jgi:hypothetical protein
VLQLYNFQVLQILYAVGDLSRLSAQPREGNMFSNTKQKRLGLLDGAAELKDLGGQKGVLSNGFDIRIHELTAPVLGQVPHSEEDAGTVHTRLPLFRNGFVEAIQDALGLPTGNRYPGRDRP